MPLVHLLQANIVAIPTMPLASIETGCRPACRITGCIGRCKELKDKNVGHCTLNAGYHFGFGSDSALNVPDRGFRSFLTSCFF